MWKQHAEAFDPNDGTLWRYNVVDGDGDKEDDIIDGADRDNYDDDDVLRLFLCIRISRKRSAKVNRLQK